MRKSLGLVVALALLLSGCSATLSAPEVSPVSFKFCAVADNFDDDGLGRAAYIALQQLKIQTGASVQATEGSLEKLVEGGCNLVIAGGNSYTAMALAAAKANPGVRFIATADNYSFASSNFAMPSNFTFLNFNMAQGGFAAGYLAAAETDTQNYVAVLDTFKNLFSKKLITNFKNGVSRFNGIHKKQIIVKQVSNLDGQEVVFVIAGNSSKLPPLNVTTSNPAIPRIIGFNRDWQGDARNVSLKDSILTSVIRIDAVGKIVEAATTESSESKVFDLTNESIGFAPFVQIKAPTEFVTELPNIIKDLVAGNLIIG